MATVDASAGISPLAPSVTAPARVPQAPPQEAPVRLEADEGLQTDTGQRVKAEAEARSQIQADDLSREEVREIAESLGQVVSVVNEGISIRIDESTDLLITEIVNRETNEVIKQIPPEELVELSGRLREFLGILLDIEV